MIIDYEIGLKVHNGITLNTSFVKKRIELKVTAT